MSFIISIVRKQNYVNCNSNKKKLLNKKMYKNAHSLHQYQNQVKKSFKNSLEINALETPTNFMKMKKNGNSLKSKKLLKSKNWKKSENLINALLNLKSNLECPFLVRIQCQINRRFKLIKDLLNDKLKVDLFKKKKKRPKHFLKICDMKTMISK